MFAYLVDCVSDISFLLGCMFFIADRSGSDVQYMFLARVLVGKHTVGSSSYKRPPPLDTTRPDGQLFDSCVNSLTNPSIFVVFEREQCYPEILIHYKDLSPPVTSVCTSCKHTYIYMYMFIHGLCPPRRYYRLRV